MTKNWFKKIPSFLRVKYYLFGLLNFKKFYICMCMCVYVCMCMCVRMHVCVHTHTGSSRSDACLSVVGRVIIWGQ